MLTKTIPSLKKEFEEEYSLGVECEQNDETDTFHLMYFTGSSTCFGTAYFLSAKFNDECQVDTDKNGNTWYFKVTGGYKKQSDGANGIG